MPRYVRVVTVLNRIMALRMTIAEWIGLAVLLAVPYLAVGVLWSLWQLDEPTALMFVRSALTWPIRLFGNGCAS